MVSVETVDGPMGRWHSVNHAGRSLAGVFDETPGLQEGHATLFWAASPDIEAIQTYVASIHRPNMHQVGVMAFFEAERARLRPSDELYALYSKQAEFVKRFGHETFVRYEIFDRANVREGKLDISDAEFAVWSQTSSSPQTLNEAEAERSNGNKRTGFYLKKRYTSDDKLFLELGLFLKTSNQEIEDRTLATEVLNTIRRLL